MFYGQITTFDWLRILDMDSEFCFSDPGLVPRFWILILGIFGHILMPLAVVRISSLLMYVMVAFSDMQLLQVIARTGVHSNFVWFLLIVSPGRPQDLGEASLNMQLHFIIPSASNLPARSYVCKHQNLQITHSVET